MERREPKCCREGVGRSTPANTCSSTWPRGGAAEKASTLPSACPVAAAAAAAAAEVKAEEVVLMPLFCCSPCRPEGCSFSASCTCPRPCPWPGPSPSPPAAAVVPPAVPPPAVPPAVPTPAPLSGPAHARGTRSPGAWGVEAAVVAKLGPDAYGVTGVDGVESVECGRLGSLAGGRLIGGVPEGPERAPLRRMEPLGPFRQLPPAAEDRGPKVDRAGA